MKVLIAFLDNYVKNPFVAELCNGFRSHRIDVRWSLREFWNSDAHFDIVHIHWPELMFNQPKYNDCEIELLCQRIMFWKRRSKVVITRHNSYPHTAGDWGKRLYDSVYALVDGVIHLGQKSLELFMEQYGESINVPHAVILHHVYPNFYPLSSESKSQSRKRLGVPNDKKLILIFGAIRSEIERGLVLSLYKDLEENFLFLIPRWRSFHKSWKRNFLEWIRFHLKFLEERRSIPLKIGYKYVSDKKAARLFNSADIVFIPRVGSLNSGLVPQAFFYKKVVVGPEVGNISEMLSFVRNPVFDSGDSESMVRAVKEAIKLDEEGHGSHNYEFVERMLTPDRKAHEHLLFFEKVLGKG